MSRQSLFTGPPVRPLLTCMGHTAASLLIVLRTGHRVPVDVLPAMVLQVTNEAGRSGRDSALGRQAVVDKSPQVLKPDVWLRLRLRHGRQMRLRWRGPDPPNPCNRMRLLIGTLDNGNQTVLAVFDETGRVFHASEAHIGTVLRQRRCRPRAQCVRAGYGMALGVGIAALAQSDVALQGAGAAILSAVSTLMLMVVGGLWRSRWSASPTSDFIACAKAVLRTGC